MRYLLIHHPGWLFAIGFIAAMVFIGRGIAPYIVAHFGIVGAVVTVLALIWIGGQMERRDY